MRKARLRRRLNIVPDFEKGLVPATLLLLSLFFLSIRATTHCQKRLAADVDDQSSMAKTYMGGKEENDKRYCTQQQKKWSKKRLVPSLAATEEEDGTAANLVRFIYPKSHAPSIERVASQKGRDGPPPIASGWSAQHHSSSPFHKRVAQVKFFPAKEKNKPHDRVLFPPIHCLYAAWFNGLANSLLCDTRRKGCICKTRITHTPLSIATRLRAPPNETSIVFCACASDTVPAVVQPGRLVFLTRRGKKKTAAVRQRG